MVAILGSTRLQTAYVMLTEVQVMIEWIARGTTLVMIGVPCNRGNPLQSQRQNFSNSTLAAPSGHSVGGDGGNFAGIASLQPKEATGIGFIQNAGNPQVNAVRALILLRR